MHCRHYIIGDIHNSIKEFNSIIDQIAPSRQDEIVLLGDVFDRGGDAPDPVGVYFRICRLGMQASLRWIRGNHDQFLAEYIYSYHGACEKERRSIQPYIYIIHLI